MKEENKNMGYFISEKRCMKLEETGRIKVSKVDAKDDVTESI